MAFIAPMMADGVDITRLTDQQLRKKLESHGLAVGPITAFTRRVYEKKLYSLMRKPSSYDDYSSRGRSAFPWQIIHRMPAQANCQPSNKPVWMPTQANCQPSNKPVWMPAQANCQPSNKPVWMPAQANCQPSNKPVSSAGLAQRQPHQQRDIGFPSMNNGTVWLPRAESQMDSNLERNYGSFEQQNSCYSNDDKGVEQITMSDLLAKIEKLENLVIHDKREDKSAIALKDEVISSSVDDQLTQIKKMESKLKENMETHLQCDVCLLHFNESERKPLLLPLCGHTFCSSCLKSLAQHKKYACPKCCKSNAIVNIQSLPVNYSMLSMAALTETKDKNDSTTQVQDGVQPQTQNSLFNRNHNASRTPRNFQASPVFIDTTKRDPFTRRNHIPSVQRQNSRCTGGQKNNLQQELDFQMAVHLTFCKDKGHNHDGDQLATHSTPWQYPLLDDINLAQRLCNL